MKTLKKLGLIAMLAGALNFGFNNQSNAQFKKIQVVDVLNGKGIPNLYVNVNGNNLYRTNDSGYTDISTGAKDIKDPNDLENKDFLNVNVNNMNANFNFYGHGTLIGYDILGRELFRKEGKDNISWNLTNLPAGFYGYILKKDEKIQTGKLISNKTGIYLGGEANKNNISSSTKSSANLENMLGKSNNAVNVSIEDELTTSADSVTSLGDYFDFEAIYSSLNDVPNVIQMIPAIQIQSPYYRNNLHFLKFITETDGNYTLLAQRDLPIKIFRNASTAPNQNYVNAVDSAISPNAQNSWPTMTSFNYKGVLLPKINLFQEVSANPDTGIIMDYSTNSSHVVNDKWSSYPYYVLHSMVYISNNISLGLIYSQTKHEIGHTLFSSAVHSLDPNHNIQSGQYISKDEGEAIKIIYLLKKFTDMKNYKED